ncbi:MAG: MBOAT family protein, partial [Planctomycetales bacterium]|nr:MBOAT family protein [Planctomycetales bacterium]
MQFNSIPFVLFLPSVWLLWAIVPSRLRWCVLLAASYAFYMCWNAFYVVLIIASTLNDYCIGIAMERVQAAKTRRLLLLTSLITNLGLLFVFKYWNFFNQSAADISAYLGLSWSVPDLKLLLPVGISFYT